RVGIVQGDRGGQPASARSDDNDVKRYVKFHVSVRHGYWASMPAALTASAQFVRSFSRSASKSSSITGMGVMPSVSSFSTASGEDSTVLMSTAIFSTMGRGVPLGAKMPDQGAAAKPGNPCSAMVG